MELSGHSGEVFTAKFDPTGNLIASGSMDRTISAHLDAVPGYETDN
jgi:WD40 repeat protein